MPVGGPDTTVFVPEDIIAPNETVPVALPLLTAEDFGIPRQNCFTPTDIAEYFLCSPRTIARLIEDGFLRGIRIRGEYKIPWREVCDFIARQQQGSGFE